MVNNRDINIDQNNRDNHFGNNRAALVAELSKPTVIVPREVVSVEEVNGEVYVRKVSRGEVKSVEGDGLLSVPVHANLEGLTPPQVQIGRAHV